MCDLLKEFDIEDLEFNPMPVEVLMEAYDEEKSAKIIYMPSGLRNRLDEVPENLCITKSVDWKTEIVFERSNLSKILEFLFQDKEPDENYEDICDSRYGDKLRLIGFWD